MSDRFLALPAKLHYSDLGPVEQAADRADRAFRESLRRGRFGGGEVPIAMRLHARMSRAERAFLFRLGPAHGAPHGQYLPEFGGCQNAPR